ncbi:MAG: hypothetical protein COB62_08040 [Piscirickettsiaceae bacterium]|nr:MAG: hypothetical protein COB62_08040 [Piscirickettsiaceae bacterium]
MKIDKIKNYNQKLLAVLGTTVTLMALVGLFSIGFFAITEIFRYSSYDNDIEGILSDEKIEELQKENKRQQLISFEKPILVDSTNLIYIIPISHKTLNEAEYVDEGIMELTNSFSSNNYNIDKRYSKSYYGSFNNLIIYYYKDNSTRKLFEDRINFTEIKTEYFDDDILILFKAADKDTYKDGVVNLNDFKKLYVYSFKEKELRKIGVKNTDIYSYSFVNGSKNLLIQFGIDQDKDGKFDSYREPTKLMQYNFEKGKLVEIIDKELVKELQNSLDGSEKE